jgi:hypothetical protein
MFQPEDHNHNSKNGGVFDPSVHQHNGLNPFFAALALLSSMIGAGISQLPHSFVGTGFTFGFITNILIIA